MEQISYHQWLAIALTGEFLLGYMVGKYLAQPVQVIEKIIYVNKEYEGTVGPDKVTCATCEKGARSGQNMGRES